MRAQRIPVVVVAVLAVCACSEPGETPGRDAAVDASSDADIGDGPDAGPGPVVDAGDADAPPPPPDQVAHFVLGFGAEPAEGGRPPLAGIAAFVDDDRVVFADHVEGSGLALSLVDLGGERARVLDQVLVDVAMDRFFGGSDWSDRFLTHVVALAPDRVAIVGTRQRVELFAVANDQLTPLARLMLDPRDDSILDAVGRGDVLWVCSGRFVRRFQLTDDAVTEIPAAAFPIPAGTCRSLSLSADGATLWVAGTGGVASFDATATPATLTRHVLARQGLARVIDQGAWLITQTLLPYGDLGPVQVFRIADLPARGDPVPVARFDPVSTDDRWQRPLAVAVVGGKLAIESIEVRGATRRYRIDLHALNDDGPGPVVDTVALRDSDEVGLHLSPLPLVGRGRHLIAQPWRRIVRVGGSPSFVTGVHHGSFDAVWSTGSGSAVALGPFSMHVVEVGDDTPVLVAGGQELPTTTSRLRVVRQDGGWQLVAATIGRPSISQEPGPARVSCVVATVDGGLALDGALTIPAGDGGAASMLAVGGGHLHQLTRTAASRYRLRRFPLPDRCDGRLLGADIDRELDIGTASGTRIGAAIAASADGTALLLADTAAAPPPGPVALQLAWLAGDDLAVVARTTLAATTADPTALAVGATGALLIENQHLVHQLTVDGGAIHATTIDVADRGLQLASILAIVGDVAYLGTVSRPLGVLAVRLPDLAALGHCATPSPPRSIARSGPDLVVGMPTALAVCRGAR